MASEADILWGMYKEHVTQGRHHEDQRATMANLMLVISGGVFGLVTFKGLDVDSWPITIFLVVLGVFGALFSAKHYERFRFHMTAAGLHKQRLEGLLPETALKSLRSEAEKNHKKKFRFMKSIHLHYFWTGIHVIIALLGALLTWIALCRS